MNNGAASQNPHHQMNTGEESVTLYLTRHGRTTANVMHIMQGWSDFPLTRQGREDVLQFGRGLRPIRFRAAWSGNLNRQYETARLALDMSGNGDLRVGVDPDLREDNFGSFEGRDERTTLDQVCAAMGFKDFAAAKAAYGRNIPIHMQDTFHRLDALDGLSTGLEEQDRAETTAQVRSRMIGALTRIAQSAIEEGGGPVLVVSSGMCLQQFLVAIDDHCTIPDMDNTAVTKVVYGDDGFHLAGPVSSMEYFQAGSQEE